MFYMILGEYLRDFLSRDLTPIILLWKRYDRYIMSLKRQGYTKFPDFILDSYQPQLSGAEFKVLAVIVRQTIGWNKKRDRLSQGFIMKKTRLSRRAVSSSVIRLEVLGMVRVSDQCNHSLSPEHRKYRNDLFFEIIPPNANNALANAKYTTSSMHYLHITRDTHNTQKTVHSNKQSDHERINEILRMPLS